MFRLHEDGAEAGDGFVLFILRPGAGGKEADWQVRQGKVKVEPGGLVKYMLSEAGGICRGCGFCGPENNIELGWGGSGYEVRGLAEAAVEFERGGAAGFEALGEDSSGGVGEEALGGP